VCSPILQAVKEKEPVRINSEREKEKENLSLRNGGGHFYDRRTRLGRGEPVSEEGKETLLAREKETGHPKRLSMWGSLLLCLRSLKKRGLHLIEKKKIFLSYV